MSLVRKTGSFHDQDVPWFITAVSLTPSPFGRGNLNKQPIVLFADTPHPGLLDSSSGLRPIASIPGVDLKGEG